MINGLGHVSRTGLDLPFLTEVWHPGFSSNKHSLMFLPKEASGRNSTYSVFFWGNKITAQTERERWKERGREWEPVTDHVWSDFICFVFFCNATDTKIFQTRINVARFSPPALMGLGKSTKHKGLIASHLCSNTKTHILSTKKSDHKWTEC